MGHTFSKIHRSRQLQLIRTYAKNRFAHGGELRKTRAGRGARPLSTKSAIHLVFKANRRMQRLGYRSPKGFAICNSVIKRYAKRFFVKIEELAICSDHIHLSVRFTKRSLGQHFLRVVAGQIAQQMEKHGLKVTDTPQGTSEEAKSLEAQGVFAGDAGVEGGHAPDALCETQQERGGGQNPVPQSKAQRTFQRGVGASLELRSELQIKKPDSEEPGFFVKLLGTEELVFWLQVHFDVSDHKTTVRLKFQVVQIVSELISACHEEGS
jgi:REP element-mobilizing transposase RayT